jgi:indole-3-glycerol phosphate synthase
VIRSQLEHKREGKALKDHLNLDDSFHEASMEQESKTERNEAGGACTRALWRRYEQGYLPVIPDIKLRSPAEGDLIRGRDPVAYALELEAAGAPVISVVTEKEHYGGSVRLLEEILRAVSVPVLRKDFIRSAEQLEESARLGVSAVLLMASVLGEEELFRLFHEAVRLGLEPLVEIHNPYELELAARLPLSFLGINNRNILTWERDDGNVGTTEELAKMKEKMFASRRVFLLSESSLMSPEELKRAKRAGAHGVLIGTALLKAENPAATYKEFSLCR